jgi:hypothetical protein
MTLITRLLDSLSAAAFKEDETGRMLYFPNGAMGSGYVVPDDAALGAIKSRLRWFYGALFISIGVGMPFLNNVVSKLELWPAVAIYAGAATLLMLCAYLVTVSASSGLQKSDERLRFTEAVSTQAKNLPRWATLTMMGMWSLGLVAAVAMLVEGGQLRETLVAAFALVSSMALLALTIVIHRARA